MNTCPECKKEATDAEAMREWFWLRRGTEGFWTCSEPCLRAYLASAKMATIARWIPTPEEEQRMKE